ncbi:putative DNA-binding transcriptional regulator YafY [Prauserella shujinwangii]|uniref:Putative DNA-binding transcriptional regulator YafY n=1 Tax=Prauserella shujinwangii TaxID=1453103 RepID=A0A2T0LNY9_9PSEU|nr:YafY family protein [Prauserella shujinwangii]PRX44953.1 putative DNA-binding transcriptional regulator YafY [Prauserella shujinwangii]
MANTSARMLRLLSLLQTHRFWPGGDLAARLEVSERTLRRDIDRLRELGYPVNATRGVAGGYQLQSGAAMPPLLVDDEEAVAIAVGLRTAAGGAVEGIEETSVRALTKVVQVMPPRLRRRLDALRTHTVPVPLGDGPRVDALTLTVLAQACRDDERLRFRYTARDGTATARLVEPHRLVPLGRRWYLVAWDAERHGWRTFRVDRLSQPTATGARFRQRELPGGDAARFVRDQLASVPTRYQVEIRIEAPAEHVARVVDRWGQAEPLDERSTLLRMNVDEFDWLLLLVAAVDAEFEVVRPAELRAYLRAQGSRFLRAAESGF